MIKILHTGDIHLDSPFAGLDRDVAKQRRRELRETFSRMMAYAKSSAVNLVLIAGDLFDKRFATRETVELICKEFAMLDCPVVISPGNHDPADGKGVWHGGNLPDNVHVFTEDTLSRFSFPEIGVNVYGYAFTSHDMTTQPIVGEFVRDRSQINILLCHADMASPVSTYAPISKMQIEAFGADYTALGHIHNGEAYSGNEGGFEYAYCGCPEGRDFGECGTKGAIIVEIGDDPSDRSVKVTRKAFCKRRYEDVTVPVDGASTMSDICSAAKNAVAGADDKTVLRITLTGTVDPSLEIDPEGVRSALSEVGEVTVRDKTSPSLAFSEDDPTVRGEFCRVLAPLLGSSDPAEREKAVLALKMGLTALSGNDL